MSTETIRIGMIGAGFISDYHVEGLTAAGAEVTAIYSRTADNARQKAASLGIPAYTDQLDDILGRDDVQAVVIATPDFTHEEIAVAAAKAGKAILLQKPMARTADECRRIIAAAQQNKVPLYVSFMHRYFPEISHTQQLLEEAALGRVYSVRQRNATGGADWADWFYQKAKVGGGVVLQLGVHGIDLLRYLFGDVEAVLATTSLMKRERTLADGTVVRPDNEDFAVALYRFRSGVIATHESVYNEVAGTDRFRMEIYGEAGTVWLRSERGELALYAPDYLQHEGWFIPSLPPAEVAYRHHRHFLAMLRGDEPDDNSAEDGLATVLIAEALYRSAKEGRWQEVETS